MGKGTHWLDDIAKRREYDKKIWCPHCGANYEICDDRGRVHITYWGSNDCRGLPEEVECDECGRTFWVTEWVERSYCSSKENKLAYENEGEAKLKGG